MSRHMHGRNLRAGRVSIPNQVYAITTVTRRRSPFFSDLPAARKLVGVLQEQAELQRATTLAYVVMPDHLHWLMQLSPGHDLSAVVRGVKSLSSRRIGRAVWQRGFHDHALRDEDDVRDWARYIVANPVRAGLVKRVGDYPHWDAVWL
jgi:putative transposase